jgi:hypothetical protein
MNSFTITLRISASFGHSIALPIQTWLRQASHRPYSPANVPVVTCWALQPPGRSSARGLWRSPIADRLAMLTLDVTDQVPGNDADEVADGDWLED